MGFLTKQAHHSILYTGYPEISSFANSEDPDEMLHCAAFQQDLHCLLKHKSNLQGLK